MSLSRFSSGMHHKMQSICDVDNQTRQLPDGSRIAACEVMKQGELLKNVFDETFTIDEAVRRGSRVSSDGPMLGYRVEGPGGTRPYSWMTYNQVISRSVYFARGLVDVGVPVGQQTRIGIYSKNRPEWVIAEHGVYNISGVVVPIYDTLGPEACSFVVNQCEMSTVICDSQMSASRLLGAKSNCASLKNVILMDECSSGFRDTASREGVDLYSFDEIEQRGSHSSILNPLELPSPDDLSTICYTSGTTGTPKGVMLTHGNVMAAATALKLVVNKAIKPEDVLFSHLPLAHMYERVVECAIFQVGARVGFSSGDIRNLPDDIIQLRPTILPLVPRLINRIYDKAMNEVKASGFFKRKLFHAALSYKTRQVRRCIIRNDSVADKFVFHKIRKELGGRVRLMITGSAPIADNVLMFARASLGCVVIEGYGLTECAAVSTLSIEADVSSGHVGIPCFCNQIKLIDAPQLHYYALDSEGEICIRGHNVFKGYFKNEDMTKEALDEDGWLHTGDIGKWTEKGTLKIIDRKKNIFKLAQGEYVAPEKIENTYLRSQCVAQVFVTGDSLKDGLVAIVVPDTEVLEAIAKECSGLISTKMSEMCSNAAVTQMVLKDMRRVGEEASLASFEQVKAIHLTPEAFGVENDLLTPTLKNRRPKLNAHFASRIQRMYTDLN